MFKIYCDNKGCGKDQEPFLNPDTNEVECSECGKAIKSVTEFTKTQMKSLGQIKRTDKSKQAFAVQCKFCSKSSRPNLDKDGKVICSLCGSHLDYVSKHYMNAIKQNV